MYTFDHWYIASLSFYVEMLFDCIQNFKCIVSLLINTAETPVVAAVYTGSGRPHRAARYFRASTTLDFPVQASQKICILSCFSTSNSTAISWMSPKDSFLQLQMQYIASHSMETSVISDGVNRS